MDGHPNDSIVPGKNYLYAFTINNRGGAYWYHTHAHHLTAKQAYGGLASFFIVEDDDELQLARALDLKLGETVRIAIDFRQASPGEQLFLFHCHNLEHEDAEMMVNFRIPV